MPKEKDSCGSVGRDLDNLAFRIGAAHMRDQIAGWLDGNCDDPSLAAGVRQLHLPSARVYERARDTYGPSFHGGAYAGLKVSLSRICDRFAAARRAVLDRLTGPAGWLSWMKGEDRPCPPNLSPIEQQVLKTLAEQGDDGGFHFGALCARLDITRAQARTACRALAAFGLARHRRNLMTDEGRFYGAGYGATAIGLAYIEEGLGDA